MISELDGWPGLTSVNASPALSRRPAHDSKPNWFATPSFVQKFHLLTLIRLLPALSLTPFCLFDYRLTDVAGNVVTDILI